MFALKMGRPSDNTNGVDWLSAAVKRTVTTLESKILVPGTLTAAPLVVPPPLPVVLVLELAWEPKAERGISVTLTTKLPLLLLFCFELVMATSMADDESGALNGGKRAIDRLLTAELVRVNEDVFNCMKRTTDMAKLGVFKLNGTMRLVDVLLVDSNAAILSSV